MPATGVMRTAVGAGVPYVEMLPASSASMAAKLLRPKRQRLLEQRPEIVSVAGEHVERVGDAVRHGLSRLSKILGVVRIGGDALEAVEQQRTQTDHVLAQSLYAFAHAERFRLGQQFGQRRSRRELRRSLRHFRRTACRPCSLVVGGAQAVPGRGGFRDHRQKPASVEIHVGQGREQRIGDETVRRRVGLIEGREQLAILGDSLDLMD